MSRISDPDGSIFLQKDSVAADIDRSHVPSLRPRLFRVSRVNSGVSVFTTLPLGANSLRKCLPSCNSRLPEFLKLLHPTGHVGRNSYVTISMNEKVSSELVALGSKHKDPKTLLGYIEPSSMSLMAGALSIGSAVASSRKRKSCGAFDSLSDSDSSVAELLPLNHEEHLSGSSSSSSSSSINVSSRSANRPNLPAVNNVYNFSFGN